MFEPTFESRKARGADNVSVGHGGNIDDFIAAHGIDDPAIADEIRRKAKAINNASSDSILDHGDCDRCHMMAPVGLQSAIGPDGAEMPMALCAPCTIMTIEHERKHQGHLGRMN